MVWQTHHRWRKPVDVVSLSAIECGPNLQQDKRDHRLVKCAWCGTSDEAEAGEQSHGICAQCFKRIMGIPLLDEADLDALPFGLIEVDSAGCVLRYNSAEQALSGKPRGDVVGKNFFTEIAPCTAIEAFMGRLSSFLASDAEPESFQFAFPFASGTVKVSIAFVNSGRGSAFVLVKRT